MRRRGPTSTMRPLRIATRASAITVSASSRIKAVPPEIARSIRSLPADRPADGFFATALIASAADAPPAPASGYRGDILFPVDSRIDSISRRSPSHRLALVLLVQPLLQRREVVADRRGVHLLLPGQRFERLRPRAALTHREHGVQLRAGFLVAVDGAAVEGAGAAGRTGQSAVELELQDVRQEVTHVRNVGGDVVLGARIEIRLAARDRRRDPLVLRAQLPPNLVVILRGDLSGEDLP